MKLKYIVSFLPLSLLLILSGCSSIGDKSMSMSIIYAATTILSLLLLICYSSIANKKNVWFLLLFSSVFVVNSGYLTLSISTNLNEALLANRISYLGSVFLPISMLMLILEACNIKYKKWFPLLLLCIGIPVFLIAASPGYLDIYYESVSLVTVNGFTTLDKTYGPWHSVYLYYLISYFTSMIAIIIYSILKKKVKSPIQAVILFTAVFINISIWFLEQLVHIEFEVLSVSYIASELFLLSLDFLCHIQKSGDTVNNQQLNPVNLSPENESIAKTSVTENSETLDSIDLENNKSIDVKDESDELSEKCKYFVSQIENLTPTEHIIYELYLSKKSTKEVLETLNIKETTLKYHNKNIYSKLGVASKKQLLEMAAKISE